jgi:ABC-2 type transport system ATP-binding protein
MTEVAEICDRVIFLQKGSIAAIDTPEELARKAALSKVRLRARIELHAELCAALAPFGEADSADGWVSVALDHHLIPRALHSVYTRGVDFEDLEVEKPTLEDFFLKLSSSTKEAP